MNRLLVVLFMLLGSMEHQATARAGEDPTCIQRGQLGEIRLGVSEKELREKYPHKIEATTVMREGREPALKYTFDNGHAVVLELTEKGIVWAIRITDPYFKTKEGYGVGNTFEEIKKAYPQGELSHGLEEGAYLSYSFYSVGDNFIFDTSGISDAWLENPKSNENVISNQKVKMVLLQ